MRRHVFMPPDPPAPAQGGNGTVRYLTAGEVAELLGMTKRAFYELRQDHKGAAELRPDAQTGPEGGKGGVPGWLPGRAAQIRAWLGTLPQMKGPAQ